MKIQLHNLTISLWEDEYETLIIRERSLIVVNKEGRHKMIKLPAVFKELMKEAELNNLSQKTRRERDHQPSVSTSEEPLKSPRLPNTTSLEKPHNLPINSMPIDHLKSSKSLPNKQPSRQVTKSQNRPAALTRSQVPRKDINYCKTPSPSPTSSKSNSNLLNKSGQNSTLVPTLDKPLQKVSSADNKPSSETNHVEPQKCKEDIHQGQKSHEIIAQRATSQNRPPKSNLSQDSNSDFFKSFYPLQESDVSLREKLTELEITTQEKTKDPQKINVPEQCTQLEPKPPEQKLNSYQNHLDELE